MDKIKFEVIDPDAAPGDYASKEDPSPYTYLADPTRDIQNLKDADEVVIQESSIRVVVDYPLSGEFVFQVVPPDGLQYFTRATLAIAIAMLYQKLYEEEDQTSPKVAGVIPGVYNRECSAGKYGIWGHGLGDLSLQGVYKRGSHYELGIDS
ncbi:hypothetical protein WJX72_007101 [[Myrmecia] bisecta]|uniref:Uncharacterized protein n=1 Tax=[Myrmecia] bisecta TaxID=41462 RepID=A0AAW1R7C6_9CHLO